MTRTTNLVATAAAVALLLGSAGAVIAQGRSDQETPQQRMQQQQQQQQMQPRRGQGMMGQGMMGQGMGPGMMGQMPGMGQGMGPGMMGQGGPMGPMVPGWGQGGPGMQGQMPGQGQGPMGPGMMQQFGPGPMGPGMQGQMPGQGQGPMGPGMMMPGMMMGQGMAPGMMGQGMGPGMMMGGHPMAGMHRMMMEHMAEHGGDSMGEGAYEHPGMLGPRFGMRVVPVMHLSADDVRRFLERQLSRQGFERLQVGAVEEVDDDTITAEIVTVDDSLVQRLEVDRNTGLISRG